MIPNTQQQIDDLQYQIREKHDQCRQAKINKINKILIDQMVIELLEMKRRLKELIETQNNGVGLI